MVVVGAILVRLLVVLVRLAWAIVADRETRLAAGETMTTPVVVVVAQEQRGLMLLRARPALLGVLV